MSLTDLKCRNAKPREKPYKLSDSGGLYLEVMSSGSKYWRLKYRFLGKEKRLAFGVYPEVSLSDARDQREHARKQLVAGADPSDLKKEAKRKAVISAANTFEVVALEWYENQLERWSKGNAEKVILNLRKNLLPYLGSRPIAQITPPEVLECLRKVEKRGALVIAGRARQLAGQIFRYGVQTGKCERDVATDLKGALKTRKKEHFSAIEAKEIPAFIQTLERNEARLFERTRRAIWLSMLTFCRPGEIRQARWSDIDLEAKQWCIPAAQMKMRRDHLVPLSRQAVAKLQEQKEETGHLNSEWVFPSQIRPTHCMSDGTVNKAIQRLGYGDDMVAHGFRALARTTIREELGYDSEIIERQLAHKASGPLGEAYDRTQFLDKRRNMMQHWADYLDAAASGGSVVAGNFRKKA